VTVALPVPFEQQLERFLFAETSATDRLVSFYAQTRFELYEFMENPPVPLTASEQSFYGALTNEVDRLSREANLAGAKWINESVPRSFVEGAMQHGGPDMAFTTVHDRAVRELSTYDLNLITQTSDGMRRVVQQQIAVGLLEGATREVVSARIRATGLTNIPRWRSIEERAAVIGRTELMRAYNAGNLAGIASTGAFLVRWITGRDERVCPICGPRHGQTFRLPDASARANDELDMGSFSLLMSRPVLDPPPAHPRCRCTVRAQYEIGKRSIVGGPKKIIDEPEPVPGGIIDTTPTPDALPPAELDMLDRLATRRFPTSAEYDRAAAYFHDLNIDNDLMPMIANTIEHPDSLTFFMRARYGVDASFDLNDMNSYWIGTVNDDMRLSVLRGIEKYRFAFRRNVDGSEYWKRIYFGTQRDMSSNALADMHAVTGLMRVSLSRLQKYRKSGSLRGGADVVGVEEILVHELSHALHNRFGMLYSTGRSRFGTWGTKASELGGGYTSDNAAIAALWKEWESIRRKSRAGIWNPGGSKVIEAHLEDAIARVEAHKKAFADFDSLPIEGTAREYVPGVGFVEKPARVVSYRRNTYSLDGSEITGFSTVKESYASGEQLDFVISNESRIVDAYRAKLAKIKKGGEHYPTEYAKTNMREDFAESGMLYLLNPEMLQQSSPLRFAFLRDRIFSEAAN
jgi:hypothetical protein